MNIEWPLLILFLFGGVLIAFSLYLSFDHGKYVEQSRNWCAEAGGVFIYPRTGPDICIDLDAVIPFTEEE